MKSDTEYISRNNRLTPTNFSYFNLVVSCVTTQRSRFNSSYASTLLQEIKISINKSYYNELRKLLGREGFVRLGGEFVWAYFIKPELHNLAKPIRFLATACAITDSRIADLILPLC